MTIIHKKMQKIVSNIDYRQIGDQPADELMEILFKRHGHKLGGILMPFLHDFDKTDFSGFDLEIKEFFNSYSVLPDFLKPQDNIRASDFFSRHQQSIGVILGCYSLPYCYLGANGVKVLGYSGRIKSDTYNRLKETGNFLRKTMNYDHWESKNVLTLLLKVRLLHAFWRIMLLNSDKWDLKWGVPVNQEDMLGTNLSFSFIVLRGLKKLGFVIDEVYEKAYLNHWAAVGYVMGIKPELTITTMKEAIKADKKIAASQFEPSDLGKELTESLMNTYTKMAESHLAGEFFKSQARLFMGDEYADWLGIPISKFPPSLLNAFNKTSSFLSNIYA